MAKARPALVKAGRAPQNETVATQDHNISSFARGRRMQVGLLVFTVGLMLSVFLVDSNLPKLWRALVFVPFHFSAVFIFQAAYRVCPMRAFRGERETDDGVEKVRNPDQRTHDKKKALTVFSTATVFALVTTASLFLLP